MEWPKDPEILVSVLNTRLRDCYGNLHELCDDLDADEGDLTEFLHGVGYFYVPEINQFRKK